MSVLNAAKLVAASICGLLFVCAASGLLTARGDEPAPANLLREPVLLEAGGETIDIVPGGSAPFFGDFDGDGLADLLVGQIDGGKLRIYRNCGTNERPRLDGFEWFKAGATGDAGHVIPSPDRGMYGGAVGFAPQLIDFHGDGLLDVLTSSGNGGVAVFRRQMDGSFAEAESLKRADGLEIVGTPGTTVRATDWDGDGDLDLVMAVQRLGISLIRNNGDRRQPTYAEPVALQVDDGAVPVRFGGAAIATADWDGDGLVDLIVGAADGSVTFYRHVGAAGDTTLAEGIVLVPQAFTDEEDPAPLPGRMARPCVCDFNGDGRLDLLVGDVCVSVITPEIQLTADQREHDASVQKKLAALSKRFSAERKSLDGDADAARDKRIEFLRVISDKMRQLRRELYRPPPDPIITVHGRVWVYLRDMATEDK